MTISVDDNLDRPIGSLVWAYANSCRRLQRLRQLKADGTTVPDVVMNTEIQMQDVYGQTITIRHKEFREYAREFDEVFDEYPVDPIFPLVAIRIERKRCGDHDFFEGNTTPPISEKYE